jgi:hypothetical protein
MGKVLQNPTSGESLYLVKKLPYFDDFIELDSLLAGALHIGVYDSIKFLMLNVVRIYFYKGQVLNHI